MRYKHMIYSAVLFAVLFVVIDTCNPASVVVPDRLCTGVHSVRNNEICHGAYFNDPAGYCSEANCHGSNLRGGNTGAPSCYACHGPYWEVKKLHTKDIYGFKHHRDVCTSADFTVTCGDPYCHGSALTGTDRYMKSPGCNKCHEIPTATGDNCVVTTSHIKVIFGKKHHRDVCTTADFTVTCGASFCHGSALAGTTNQYRTVPGCNKCHGIPTANGSNCEIISAHTYNIDGHLHHRDVTTTLNTCKTAECHGTNLSGGTTGPFRGPACTKCHEQTPTEPGGGD